MHCGRSGPSTSGDDTSTTERNPVSQKRPSRRVPTLFVYGSLMHRKYWRGVVGAAAAIRITPARLRGWRRWWNGVRPSYGGAVLNMKRDPAWHLWGGVVEGLTAEAWARLDEQERSHLPRTRVLVVTARGRRVWAYCYRQRVRGPERMPAAGYVAAVRAGAKALGMTVSRDVDVDVARLCLLARGGTRGPRRRSAKSSDWIFARTKAGPRGSVAPR